jgi:hypothetical protein
MFACITVESPLLVSFSFLIQFSQMMQPPNEWLWGLSWENVKLFSFVM